MIVNTASVKSKLQLSSHLQVIAQPSTLYKIHEDREKYLVKDPTQNETWIF